MSPECEILPNFHWKVGSHKYCIFVEKEEEVASMESDHFQSLVPNKEASIIVLLLEDSVKVSGPGRQRWSSPRTQADAASSCLVFTVISLLRS